jgi:hypothetical protein
MATGRDNTLDINVNAARQLKTDRTYRFHNSDLNCVVGQQRNEDQLKFFPFEFWYATETTIDDLSFLRTLEAKLFKAVSSHVFWCYGQYATVNFSGRKLTENEVSQRELEIELARRLGVVSVSSGGYDTISDCKSFLPLIAVACFFD